MRFSSHQAVIQVRSQIKGAKVALQVFYDFSLSRLKPTNLIFKTLIQVK